MGVGAVMCAWHIAQRALSSKYISISYVSGLNEAVISKR